LTLSLSNVAVPFSSFITPSNKKTQKFDIL